jgi:hypothetical protein
VPGVGGDLLLGTRRCDVPQSRADRAQPLGEGLVGEEEGLLPPGQWTQGRREQAHPGDEGRRHDEE